MQVSRSSRSTWIFDTIQHCRLWYVSMVTRCVSRVGVAPVVRARFYRYMPTYISYYTKVAVSLVFVVCVACLMFLSTTHSATLRESNSTVTEDSIHRGFIQTQTDNPLQLEVDEELLDELRLDPLEVMQTTTVQSVDKLGNLTSTTETPADITRKPEDTHKGTETPADITRKPEDTHKGTTEQDSTEAKTRLSTGKDEMGTTTPLSKDDHTEEATTPSKEAGTTEPSPIELPEKGDQGTTEQDASDRGTTPAQQIHTIPTQEAKTETPDDVDVKDMPEEVEVAVAGVEMESATQEPRDLDYALSMSKSVNNTVILVIVSYNYIQLALNFYATSARNHRLTNVLFIALDQESCTEIMSKIRRNTAHCYVFKEIPTSHEDVLFGSRQFTKRANVKPLVTWKALRRGYRVLLSDVDVTFKENPFPYLQEVCKENCDLTIQWDKTGFNSGFVYARPTRSTIKIYSECLKILGNNRRITDQTAFNMAMKRVALDRKVRIRTLNFKQFPSGHNYFEGMFCPSKERAKEVVVVHNNWIIGKEPKIMRSRECQLWEYEGEDLYYSNDRRKYITLTKPVPIHRLGDSLLNLFSIATILKRVPILPMFYTKYRHTSYPSWPVIKGVAGLHNFNNATSAIGYRESSFLKNRMVPSKVKASVSRVYKISPPDYDKDLAKETAYLILNNFKAGPNIDTINIWFQAEKRSVLRLTPINIRFTNLYYSRVVGQKLVAIFERITGASNSESD